MLRPRNITISIFYSRCGRAMPRLWLTLLLSCAAYAGPLQNLTTACHSNATAPHEWPYEDCCAAYKLLDESVWCAAGVRNSSGYAALNVWAGEYSAYRVAEECGAALPSCFVDADREATAIQLTKLIDWGLTYEDDTLRWDAEMTAICHADIEYWQPHIGAYIGRNEFIEYAYTLSPKFNGESFLHSPIHIVSITPGDDWVVNYTWRTAAGFNGETLDGQPNETTILKLGFSDDPGQAYRLTYTEFSRPTYEFMSQISMTPSVLCGTALAYCPGTLFPYDSVDTCVGYLSETVPGACLDGATRCPKIFATNRVDGVEVAAQSTVQRAQAPAASSAATRAHAARCIYNSRCWTRSSTVPTWALTPTNVDPRRDRASESLPTAPRHPRPMASSATRRGRASLRSVLCSCLFRRYWRCSWWRPARESGATSPLWWRLNSSIRRLNKHSGAASSTS